MNYEFVVLVPAEYIPRIHLINYTLQFRVESVGNYYVADLQKLVQITHNARVEKMILLDYRLINNDFQAFGFQPLHDALYRRLAVVVRIGFHRKPIDTNCFGAKRQYLVCNMIFPCAVSVDDSPHYVTWNFIEVCEELLCVFWQAVATIAK